MRPPTDVAHREGRSPWYEPRTKSQAYAWIVTAVAIASAIVVFGVPLLSSDATRTREYLVIVVLGAGAIVFAAYVVDRLRVQAGERIETWRALPWRKTLKTEDTLRWSAALEALPERRLHLPEVDLSEASLPSVDLEAANLIEASLRNANLTASTLRAADLAGADLRGADLRRADLSRSSLIGASLEGARLDRANLAGADLESAELQDVSLEDAAYDERTNWPEGFSPEIAGARLVGGGR